MNLNAHGEAWAPGFATDSSALDCVTSHLALIVHMTWLPTALNLGFQKDNLVKKIHIQNWIKRLTPRNLHHVYMNVLENTRF